MTMADMRELYAEACLTGAEKDAIERERKERRDVVLTWRQHVADWPEYANSMD